MEVGEILLHIVVFVAALLQAATGLGFGLLAGPVILLVLNSGSAIQISLMLSLLIAGVLSPTLKLDIDRPLLKRVMIGSIPGLALGIIVFQAIDLAMLKLLAGFTVLYMVLTVTGFIRIPESRGGAQGLRDFGAGILSGAMTTSVAMPGPAVAARMAALSRPKANIRATVLMVLVLANIAGMGVQAATVGVARETLVLTAWLAPATLVGVVLGRLIVHWFSERGFRIVLILLLGGTTLSLFVNAIAGMLGYV
jgi:uncharacterized membrane protein YfcA